MGLEPFRKNYLGQWLIPIDLEKIETPMAVAHPVGLVEESEVVNAARRVIVMSLDPRPTLLSGEPLNKEARVVGPYDDDQIELAKWVIENIWTPDTKED